MNDSVLPPKFWGVNRWLVVEKESSVRVNGKMAYITDFPNPVVSETNTSFPFKKDKTASSCCLSFLQHINLFLNNYCTI